MTVELRAEHWAGVWAGPEGHSWDESTPTTSLELIGETGLGTDASVVDVGGGGSVLVDALLALGWVDLTVVDLAPTALERTRTRLADAAEQVSLVCADVLEWRPDRRYDLWHDRALFHFLTDEEERARYVRTLTESVSRGGFAVVATFATGGPETCSGLPVVRYDGEALACVFAPAFRPIRALRRDHVTPWGAIQPFTWVLLRPSGRSS